MCLPRKPVSFCSHSHMKQPSGNTFSNMPFKPCSMDLLLKGIPVVELEFLAGYS